MHPSSLLSVGTYFTAGRGFPGKPGFRPRTPARLRLAHAREGAQYSVVKERATSRLPLGARLESTRPRKVPGRTVSDSRIAPG